MYLSMIEFSMTLKFVIKDGFEKKFQKKENICYYVRQSFVGTLIWIFVLENNWAHSLFFIFLFFFEISLLHFAYEEKELN